MNLALQTNFIQAKYILTGVELCALILLLHPLLFTETFSSHRAITGLMVKSVRSPSVIVLLTISLSSSTAVIFVATLSDEQQCWTPFGSGGLIISPEISS